MYVFHSVNAGLFYQVEDCGLLIDTLHDGGRGFSCTPGNILNQIAAHTNVAAKEIHLAFTHLHDDHFSGKQVRDFMRKYPTAKICVPEMWISGVNSDENIRRTYILDLGRFHLTAFPTVHDGKEYAKVPHQSLMLQAAGQQHLLCGDARLDLSLARHVQRACPGDICAAFVNVYQLASKPGQAFLKAICPRHIFLYHLPFKEDDIFSYRKIAISVIMRLPQELKYVQLLEPMQSIF